jgi:hypothetical protein
MQTPVETWVAGVTGMEEGTRVMAAVEFGVAVTLPGAPERVAEFETMVAVALPGALEEVDVWEAAMKAACKSKAGLISYCRLGSSPDQRAILGQATSAYLAMVVYVCLV